MGIEIIVSITFAALLVYQGGRRQKEAALDRFALWGGLLLFSAFLLRLLLGYYTQGYQTDIDTFKSWGRILNEVGFKRLYQQDIYLDYPPGYLYVLGLLDRIRLFLGLPEASGGYTLLMKTPAIFADLLCGWALLRLGRPRIGDRAALFVSGAYLFCPAVLVNSAQWGQVDSFCTALLLGSVLLLYKEKYPLSGLIYGLAVICKPQMLIFAPLYLFFALKRRRWAGLGLGIACALFAILLCSLPFTKGFNFLWLIEKYRATLEYYDYYSLNAYNFWALIGKHWQYLPGPGLHKTLLTLAAPVLATACCGAVIFLSRRKDCLFICPSVLMAVMYLFGVKMHERYLFPMFLFLLLAFIAVGDKRLLWAYGLACGINYLNVAHVLWIFHYLGNNYDPNHWAVQVQSFLQAGALGYFFYVAYSVYIRGKICPPQRERAAGKPWVFPKGAKMCRADWLCMALVTLCYAGTAFWNLGGHTAAISPWTPLEGEQAVLEAQGEADALHYCAGIAPDVQGYAARVGTQVQVEVSRDGQAWTDCGALPECYVFAWQQFSLPEKARYVRLTAPDSFIAINEIGLSDGSGLLPLTAQGPGAEKLMDEQGAVPLSTTYENSAYFDEIYHARTAYEHLQGLEPYENTHPPLGKYIIALGISLFGMNPFGWRFMGTLFGVLMLPVFYYLAKQLLGKTWLCAMGTFLFAFDFMHFTQTRIATIDTYAVFFLLLMYSCMWAFLRQDILRDGWRRLLPPLALSGFFMGLGIASKWTCAYGAVGLAVLYFWKLWIQLREEKQAGRDMRPALIKAGKLCGWCCLFFVLIPFALYFCAFLPMTTLPHNAGNIWGSFWNYQTNMFHYHAQLQAEHYFASPWYEWPVDLRPIWYFAGGGEGAYSTISAMGSPLLWWAGLLALPGAAVLLLRDRRANCALLLAGYLSVYLPWVLVPRLTFIYHYFTAVPFLVLALLAAVGRWEETPLFSPGIRLGAGREGAPTAELPLVPAFLFVFCAGCLGLFLLYYPVISGAPTTRAFADALELLPDWHFA